MVEPTDHRSSGESFPSDDGRSTMSRWWFAGDERLVMICISTVLVMTGQGIVGPVLPLFARDFGVGTAVVGLTFTAFGLARMVLNIPAGLWADRRGRRVLLVGGPLVTAVGMIGSGLAPSIWILLGWRLVAGAGSALYMTGAQIYLIDIAGPDRRARYIATNQGALFLGVSFGPALGGLLTDWLGFRAPFLVVGLAAFGTAIYSWYRLPETGDRFRLDTVGPEGARRGHGAETTASDDPADETGEDDEALNLASLWRSPQFIAIGLVSFSVFCIRGARQSLVPLHASETFGLGPGEIGLIFAAISLVGFVLISPAGRAADRLGRRLAIVPPGYVGAFGMLVAAAASSSQGFVVGLLISAVGLGVTGPAPAAFVADIAPERLRGSVLGVYRTWGDLGIVLSPPLSGLLADGASIAWALAANGLLLGVTVTWFVVAGRDRVPRGVPVDR